MTQHSDKSHPGCTCHCAEEIIQHFSRYINDHPECEIYQTSLMSSLIAGIYEGSTTIADLLKHGDFGLGTFNNLDGELIAFDSNVFQLHSDGNAQQATPEQCTPFAVFTFFRPTMEYRFTQSATKQDVHHVIDSLVPSDNIFCALRIDGEFTRVDTRTVPRQEKPYRPMLEAIEQQPIFHFKQEKGLIVGFRSPQYTQGINVAGYHEHFITDNRQGGGHILDYELEHGVLQLATVTKLVIDLPKDAAFLTADLSNENIDSAIRQAES